MHMAVGRLWADGGHQWPASGQLRPDGGREVNKPSPHPSMFAFLRLISYITPGIIVFCILATFHTARIGMKCCFKMQNSSVSVNETNLKHINVKLIHFSSCGETLMFTAFDVYCI